MNSLYVAGNTIVNSGVIRLTSGNLYINTSSSPSERCYIGGSATFAGNIKSNHHDPRSNNTYNQGGSSTYWAYVNCHDVSYHSLGFYDDGVTVQKNGKLQKVSDVEAIKLMKAHKTLKTKDGSPLLDKKSLPVEMFLPARRQDGTLYDRSENDIPLVGKEDITYDKNGKQIIKESNQKEMEDADGESGAQLLALTLGAIRELDTKIELLKTDIVALKKK
jgi:hypothetical protein